MIEKEIIPKVYEYLNSLGFTEENINLVETENYSNDIEISASIKNKSRRLFIVRMKNKITEEEIAQLNYDAYNFFYNFFLITNGDQFLWYKTTPNKLKKATSPPSLKHVLETVTDIHNEIFEFLHKKYLENNNFRFRVRQRNTKERLSNGYWFNGSDSYLIISMWAGGHWHTKTPYIYFYIDLNAGSVELIFTTKASNKIAQFTQSIAPVLGLNSVIRKKEITFWRKVYARNWEKSFIDVLDKFIQTEKVTIDNAILVETKIKGNDLDGLDLISKEDFNKSLEKILRYRDKPNFKKTKPVNYKDYPIVPQELILQNIGHYRKIELDVSPRIICLFGENGIGKTTLLRALLLALTGVDESNLIDSTDLRYQRLLHIQNVNKDGTIQYAQEGVISLNYHHYEKALSKIEFKLRDSIVQISDVGEDDLPSFTTTDDKSYFTQLIIGFAQVQGRHKNGQIETVNPIKQANVRDILPLLQDVEDNRFEDLSDWILELYGESVTDNENREKEILYQIFDIITEITETPIQFEKVKFTGRIIWVKIKNTKIPFRLLSQGYKNVFAWIGHFIKRLAEANNYDKDFMQKNAILVIDEIDTYLHPKWQRNILNVLVKRFPNTRFVVTTHSPLVANYLEEEDKAVYLLKEQTIEKVEHVYGRELSYIFRKLMAIGDRPKVLQDKIDTLFDLLDEDTKSSMKKARTLFKELSEQLSEDDGDLIQAKTYLELETS